MKNLKRYLRLYKALASQFLKMIVQSKVDFIMGLFGFLFSELLGLVFLVLVFRQIPDLQGWTFDQLVFIYGFAHVVLFIVSVIAGAIIYTSIKLFFATIAFWVKISGPFLQVAYLPASYFLMADKSWLVIVVECVIALVFWVVAYSFFNYGISKYESAGN